MVHQVILFIDGIHFGLAIECSDGWYKFEYAADGAKGLSSDSSKSTKNAVTVKRSAPTGEEHYIGDTTRGLDPIIEFARQGS